MSVSPDDDTFRHLALTFSKSHHTMSTRTSRCDTPKVFTDGITNGAKWYPVYGKFGKKYMYRFYVTFFFQEFSISEVLECSFNSQMYSCSV